MTFPRRKWAVFPWYWLPMRDTLSRALGIISCGQTSTLQLRIKGEFSLLVQLIALREQLSTGIGYWMISYQSLLNYQQETHLWLSHQEALTYTCDVSKLTLQAAQTDTLPFYTMNHIFTLKTYNPLWFSEEFRKVPFQYFDLRSQYSITYLWGTRKIKSWRKNGAGTHTSQMDEPIP